MISSPSGLGTADAVGLDLLLVAAVPVRAHRVGRKAAGLAPLGEVRPDVGVERVHQDLVGAEHVASRLSRLDCRAIHEQGARGHLLDVQQRPDLAGDLLLDVVALIEHQRHVAAGAVPAAADHLDHDPEQLERIGAADDQVVVRVETAVEVERPELAEPQQLGGDELDVGPGRVMTGVEAHDGPVAESDAVHVRRAPVRDVGVVERRLEELVLEDEPLVVAQLGVDLGQTPRPASPDAPGCLP